MRLKLFFSLITLFFHLNVYAEELLIAAASDLKFAMRDIVSLFETANPDVAVKTSFGSSGKFLTQIRNGAPYDLYFSADISFPQQLKAMGYSSSAVVPYAKGRLVLLSYKNDLSNGQLDSLLHADFERIAIANPRHAPYGMRAKEVLVQAGLWTQLTSKIIYGDSVSHTAQLIVNQHVDAGIVALSLVKSAWNSSRASYILIPETLHSPLLQGFIVTQHGGDNPTAWRFHSFMQSGEVAKILTEYGFETPNQEAISAVGG
ncbi:molybdate ABC transporter substrate-binding protein [Pseudidiomarina taiwanensis]|uniref:Molybdate ABC transporter substrate-binding protein n=1 Tax=Pseudidiomarina taiwanensis TaxID=337250 RepID=A0A432ZEZ6_9GAMM|nr:molybdate ABC transporter substrate-binding protein [Pseudidiomarina taiwanensis]RUO76536.1 molybdate ABC transporter substrate-binding protein [Pseudidiomarina taiwanensis]